MTVSSKKTPQMTMRDGVNQALMEAMERDPSVIVMGEDVAGGAGMDDYDAMGSWGGVFGVTQGLAERFGRQRVLDTPLAEASFVSAAVGAAMNGMRPVVELMFVDFMGFCLDPIFNQGARVRYMSGGQVKVPLVVRTAFGGGLTAGPQHSGTYYSIFAHLPGIKVVVPSTPADAQGLLAASILDDDVVVFFEHKALYTKKGPVAPPGHVLPLGKCDVKREGLDVTIVGVGQTVLTALAAAKDLQLQGVSAEVIDLRSIVPLDLETILESVKKTGRLVVVDEDNPRCSVATDIVAQVCELAFGDLLAAPVMVMPPSVPVPFGVALENAYLPNAADVVSAVQQTVSGAPIAQGS